MNFLNYFPPKLLVTYGISLIRSFQKFEMDWFRLGQEMMIVTGGRCCGRTLVGDL
jgi:hypothetical protein